MGGEHRVLTTSTNLIHSVYFQPFNREYIWDNTSDNEVLADPSISALNDFKGSATQQATSVVTSTNQLCYELVENCFSIYGFEASMFYSVRYYIPLIWTSSQYKPGKAYCNFFKA